MPRRPIRQRVGQSGYSARDIPDLTSPQGVRELNQELRRIEEELRRLARRLQEKEEETRTVQEQSRAAATETVTVVREEAATQGEQESAIELRHNGAPLGRVQRLDLEDRTSPIKYRIYRQNGTAQVQLEWGREFEAETTPQLELARFWIPVVKWDALSNWGEFDEAIRSFPDAAPVYMPGTYATIPYKVVEAACDAVTLDFQIQPQRSFVVNKTGWYNLHASLLAYCIEHNPTHLQYAPLFGSRIVVLRNGRRYTMLDYTTTYYKCWHQPYDGGGLYCPTAPLRVFLGGSENCYFEEGDEIAVCFNMRPPVNPDHSRWLPYPLDINFQVLPLFGHLTIAYLPTVDTVTHVPRLLWDEDAGRDTEEGAPYDPIDFVLGAEEEGEQRDCGCRHQGGLGHQIEVGHNGQTVFLIPDEFAGVPTRLVVNGVEYRQDVHYTIEESPTRMVWNGFFALSTEDDVFLWAATGGSSAASRQEYTTVRIFTFNTPESVWTVAHNLGRYPTVHVTTLGGAEIVATVVHESENLLRVHHATPMAGRVIVAL
jgi:hypothetical protein